MTYSFNDNYSKTNQCIINYSIMYNFIIENGNMNKLSYTSKIKFSNFDYLIKTTLHTR